jgi:hypothetical protein
MFALRHGLVPDIDYSRPCFGCIVFTDTYAAETSPRTCVVHVLAIALFQVVVPAMKFAYVIVATWTDRSTKTITAYATIVSDSVTPPIRTYSNR